MSHSSRSIYRVKEKTISIRTTTKPGPIYWYDISESIMNGVEYLIYQTSSSNHFALFPSGFFKECYGKLRDSNRAEGFDYDEIAATTGLAKGAIGTTLCRARKRLVEAYRAQEKDKHVAS